MSGRFSGLDYSRRERCEKVLRSASVLRRSERLKRKESGSLAWLWQGLCIVVLQCLSMNGLSVGMLVTEVEKWQLSTTGPCT